MTDKQEFLDKLRVALIEREVSETDISPYIERFDRFFDRMVNDPENNRNDLLDDIESIADNIAAQVSARYDDINRLAERTMTIERVETDDESVSAHDTGSESTKLIPADESIPPENQQPKNLMTANQRAGEGPEEQAKKLPDYVEMEETAPNSTIFWVLFGVSLPVTVPLALAAVGIFIFVWGGLAALIIFSIAALIALVAGGTALSLIGIIYGITKLFSLMPVGVYEIGLGVLVGAGVMFSGILIYNFAVRLLPYLMKLVAKLFRFLYGQLKVLFVFLRRECAKL